MKITNGLKSNKILVTNKAKVEDAITAAEGKATARTVDYDTICRVIAEVSSDIPKMKLNGTTVHYDGAERFPNAYKYAPESTHWIAKNVHGTWYITDIYRDTCPNRVSNTHVTYSDEAKEYILEKASNRHC